MLKLLEKRYLVIVPNTDEQMLVEMYKHMQKHSHAGVPSEVNLSHIAAPRQSLSPPNVEIQLIQVPEGMSRDDAQTELAQIKLKRVSSRELLALGICYPELQWELQDPIENLGEDDFYSLQVGYNPDAPEYLPMTTTTIRPTFSPCYIAAKSE